MFQKKNRLFDLAKLPIKKAVDSFGYAIVKKTKFMPLWDMSTDADQLFQRCYELSREFTMTSVERMFALHQAVRYVVAAKIEGDFVECGLWRGGSSMMAAMSFIAAEDLKRDFYLFDTYDGMPQPEAIDKNFGGEHASIALREQGLQSYTQLYAASLEEVQANIKKTGYPYDKLHFIKGKVEDTIPQNIPQKIAILRLDTDWYSSTKHELVHLYPLLVKGGVLIIDDYGHWQGARKAVDEYIADNNLPILLNRIDSTGRIAVKALD